MNTLLFFIKGFLIGLSVSIPPIGPVSILVIRRTIIYNRISGFLSGLGSAIADGIYALIAALGITFIATLLTQYKYILRISSGIFICGFGLYIFNSKLLLQTNPDKKGLLRDFFSTLAITLSNPLLIMFFMAVFAMFETDLRPSSISFLLSGIIAGSTTWWFILVNIVHFFKSKITTSSLIMINKIAGVTLIIFGIITLFGFLS